MGCLVVLVCSSISGKIKYLARTLGCKVGRQKEVIGTLLHTCKPTQCILTDISILCPRMKEGDLITVLGMLKQNLSRFHSCQ